MKLPAHLIPIVEALLITVIWGSSFVLTKIGLEDIGPFTLAGLRYLIGGVIILLVMFARRQSIPRMSSSLWFKLIAMGLSAYTIGNGGLYWGLTYLPATTGAFLMSAVPLLVLIGSIVWLRELPNRRQVAGVWVSLVGAVLFFWPGLHGGELVGILIVMGGLVGFALFGVLARSISRDQEIGTLARTAIPLLIGGVSLLCIGIPTEPVPIFNPTSISIVLVLALVNTALAYTLYSHAVQEMTALEMSVLLNLSPLATAGIAWLLLGETLAPIQLLGTITVIGGVVLVQNRRPTG